jgi:hypothetical protein
MKEVSIFESWANTLVENVSSIGTPVKSMGDRPIPRQKDVQYKAQVAHPDLSPEQALALYISDELEQNAKTDQMQNQEISDIEHDEQSIKTDLSKIEHDEVELQTQLARLVDLVKRK